VARNRTAPAEALRDGAAARVADARDREWYILRDACGLRVDGDALRRAICFISKLMKRGAMPVPFRTAMPMDQVAAAHTKLEQHQVHGRVLLIP
jgi:hypothetical protein